jgi:putative oxidoreductase
MHPEFPREPKLLIPALQPFYDKVVPLSWLVVRFGVGWVLLVHGWGKVMRGPAAQEVTLNTTLPWAVGYNWHMSLLLTFVEGLGGLCIILGLFTRFFAAANAIEMGFLTFIIYWSNGFSWLNRGYEFTLMWGFLCLAIALRGGGPYSLDRAIGREL